MEGFCMVLACNTLFFILPGNAPWSPQLQLVGEKMGRDKTDKL